jgi:hypothetical protein
VNIYTGDVCSRHLADITKRRADVCCWGRSKHWPGPGFPELHVRDRFVFWHPGQPVHLEGECAISRSQEVKSLRSRNVPKLGEIRPNYQRAFWDSPSPSSNPGNPARQCRLLRVLYPLEMNPPFDLPAVCGKVLS